MAVEARVAVVLIARDLAMFVVHVGLIVLVAEDTFEDGIVGGIHVAIAAHVPLVFMFSGVDREVLRVMVPVGGCPGRGGVTRLTFSRKQRRGVVRVRCAVISRLMTAVTVGRRSHVTAGVTGDTLQHRVRTGQRKRRRAMIERRR